MVRNIFYLFYCEIHRIAKKVFQKEAAKNYRLVTIGPQDFSENEEIKINGCFINDIEMKKPKLVRKNQLFPVENIVGVGTNKNLKDSYKRNKKLALSFGVNTNDVVKDWESFINSSTIPHGYKNSGLHYAGYIADNINEWCLPSWIWTNAAIVRMYCKKGNIAKAQQIADLLLEKQLDSGGWIVRNDYGIKGSIPTLAPNDSAYIANNALIEVYKATKNILYLKAAKKCADWIIETARPDGLVWSGYDIKRQEWIKNHIIVDTGFTAGLFANLYDITDENKYKNFLINFVNQYIKLFYIPSEKGFATSINGFDEQNGGMFGRGQAWALEGLIPAFRILKTNEIKQVIEGTINNLLKQQLRNGGWAYNFSKPLLGEDCKGIAVIAKNLLDWNMVEQNKMIISAVEKAMKWCIKHTSAEGVSKGGTFSYSMEGAIVHNFYTQTAFVYSSAYAIEAYETLNNNK